VNKETLTTFHYNIHHMRNIWSKSLHTKYTHCV